MNIEKFKNWMLAENYSVETIKSYTRYLRQIEDDVDLDELDEYYEVARYLHDSDFPRNQKNNVAKAVNAYLKMLGVDYRLKLDKRKGYKDTWIPTAEHKKELLKVRPWKNRYYNERNSLLLEVIFEAGSGPARSPLSVSRTPRKGEDGPTYT